MPNSKAEFYYRSYIDMDVTGYTLSGDLLNDEKMLDRNKNTFSGTDGSNDDTDTVEEIFDLGWARSVDTFVLRSNLTDFDIQYWDGAAWQAFSPAVLYTTNTETFLLIKLSSPVSTSKIKLTMTKTIVADEEKKIYQFEITKKITELYLEDVDIKEQWEQKEFKNIYGGSIFVVFHPNHGKKTIIINFSKLTDTEYTAYKTIKDRKLKDAYNIYCYLSDEFDLFKIDAYYLVNDVADFESSPSTDNIIAGIDGKLILQEC